MNRSQHLRRWLRALTIYERRLLNPVARNRNAFIAHAAAEYGKHQSVPQHVRFAHEIRVQNLLIPHLQAVIPYFGAMTVQQFKSRRPRMELKRMTFLSLMQDWVRQHALKSASSIAATDYDDVHRAIEHGIDDGLGTEEIARNIRKVSGLTAFRAATVARTETHAAATFGAIEEARQTAQEIGIVLQKEWLPTLYDRTRPDHAAMVNHPPIPLDALFTVGDAQMDRPGDPSAPLEQICNCRCAIATTEAP